MGPRDWITTAAEMAAYLRATGKSGETERTYIARARLYATWCLEREVMPELAEPSCVAAFIAQRLTEEWPDAQGHLKHLSTYGVRNDLYAIRAYYGFIRWRGMRDDDPSAGLKVRKPKTLPKQPVGIDDVKKLAYGASSVRDQAIITFFYATGARLAEVAGIQIQYVLWDKSTILLHGKGDKWRPVEVGPELLALLHLAAGGRTNGPLWLNKDGLPLTKNAIRRNFYRLCQRKRVTAHPHQLRATFANNYLHEGGDLGGLKEVMGHADIATTAHYAQATALERGLETMRRLNLGARIA